jgi:hypothetical protein
LGVTAGVKDANAGARFPYRNLISGVRGPAEPVANARADVPRRLPFDLQMRERKPQIRAPKLKINEHAAQSKIKPLAN